MIVTLDQRLLQADLLGLVLGLGFVFAADTRGHVLLLDPACDPDDAAQPVRAWPRGVARRGSVTP